MYDVWLFKSPNANLIILKWIQLPYINTREEGKVRKETIKKRLRNAVNKHFLT